VSDMQRFTLAAKNEAGGVEVLHDGFVIHGQDGGADSENRMAALSQSMYLSDMDVLRIAQQRGLAPGVLGSRALQFAQSGLGEQYDLNLAALRDLGFKGEALKDVPDFDKVLEGIGLNTLMRLGRRSEQGYQDHLIISPSLRKIGLMGTRNKPGIIPRFDRRQSREKKTALDKEQHKSGPYFEQIGDRDRRHDPSAGGDWVVAIELDHRRGADRQSLSEDAPRGLRHVGLHTRDQRELFKVDAEDNDFDPRLTISSMGIGQVFVRNAQQRQLGEQLLDELPPVPDFIRSDDKGQPLHAMTKLIHYPDRQVRYYRHVPVIAAYNGQVALGSIKSGELQSMAGVREVLQVAA
jgi:hypothetical protein